jgi:hypothetical protein
MDVARAVAGFLRIFRRARKEVGGTAAVPAGEELKKP